MKKLFLTILSCSVVFTAAQNLNAEDSSTFKSLIQAPTSKVETFFKVIGGEAKINGSVIKLLVVKPEYLSVSYKNDSKEALYPNYQVKTYNKYGYMLGEQSVGGGLFGGISQLETGDVGGEKIHLNLIDHATFFKHTVLKLPADFADAAWLSISECNSQLQPASTNK